MLSAKQLFSLIGPTIWVFFTRSTFTLLCISRSWPRLFFFPSNSRQTNTIPTNFTHGDGSLSYSAFLSNVRQSYFAFLLHVRQHFVLFYIYTSWSANTSIYLQHTGTVYVFLLVSIHFTTYLYVLNIDQLYYLFLLRGPLTLPFYTILKLHGQLLSFLIHLHFSLTIAFTFFKSFILLRCNNHLHPFLQLHLYIYIYISIYTSRNPPFLFI